MRELHVVALSEDGRFAVLATSPDSATGTFRVALDDRLAAALRGDPGVSAPEPSGRAALSPREIQARLRAGESAAQIAHAAGVDIARVERFSGPVQTEQARVLGEVRATVLTRPRAGASCEPLGRAVDSHLDQIAQVREGSVRWAARREVAGRWLVELSYVSRGRARVAGWWWDPVDRSVTPVDAASLALAHVESGGRRGDRRPPQGRLVGAPADAPPRPAVRRPSARSAAGPGAAPSAGSARAAGASTAGASGAGASGAGASAGGPTASAGGARTVVPRTHRTRWADGPSPAAGSTAPSSASLSEVDLPSASAALRKDPLHVPSGTQRPESPLSPPPPVSREVAPSAGRCRTPPRPPVDPDETQPVLDRQVPLGPPRSTPSTAPSAQSRPAEQSRPATQSPVPLLRVVPAPPDSPAAPARLHGEVTPGDTS